MKSTRLIKIWHIGQKGQKGITGLETAIILIAFVTVAAVLAYTVLSAGIFSSERGKEAVYKGIESSQTTLELKGAMIAVATTDNTPAPGVPATFTDVGGAGTNLGSPDLPYGNTLVDASGAGQFTVTLAAGASGTVTSGTTQVTSSPLTLVVGANTIETNAAGTFTIFLAPGGALALNHATFSLGLVLAGTSIDIDKVGIRYWDSTFSAVITPAAIPGAPVAGEWDYILAQNAGGHTLIGTDLVIVTVMIPAGAQVNTYEKFTIEITPPMGAATTLQRTLPPIATVMSLN